MGSMGRKDRKTEAPAALNMLPKLDDVAMRTYFMVLAKMRRPSMTPSASTPRSLSSSTTSAASLATSVPESTEIPTSAWCRATASLTPSPRKATSFPVRRATLMIRDFWSGPIRANTVVVGDRRLELVVVERTRPRAPVSTPAQCDADVRAHLGRHQAVVPGDDLDLDPQPLESGDGRRRRRPWAGRRRSGTPRGPGPSRPPAVGVACPRAARTATATTRAPPENSASRADRALVGDVAHRSKTTSGAPLVMTTSGRPSGPSTSTEASWRSWSKGTTPRRR